MIDRTLLTANDFIGVRAALVAELGNDPARALVLTRIYYRADSRWREAHEADGYWWWRASQATVADETGMTETQVQRILNSLAEGGHIERVKHRVNGVSDHTYSMRVICGIESAESQDHHSSESRNLPTMQTPKTVDRSALTKKLSDFEKFYAMWPRKVAKPAAQRAFLAASKRVDPQVILAGAAAYRRWYLEVKQDLKFVPYPATWLNADGWNDQLIWPEQRPAPAPAQPRKLTAVEQNLVEFERMHGQPAGITPALIPAPSEGVVIHPYPHHARIDYRVIHPDATTNQVFILCPECESEWGWRDDVKGSVADLEELAALHNSGADRG